MFEWQEYLDVARHLATRGGEANQRSAISRAYYAVFGTARAWLIRNEPHTYLEANGQDHRVVWQTFKQAASPLDRQIGERGSRLRDLRGRADYETVVKDLVGVTTTAIQTAEWIIEKLNAP